MLSAGAVAALFLALRGPLAESLFPRGHGASPTVGCEEHENLLLAGDQVEDPAELPVGVPQARL